MGKISLVLPVYNEAKILQEVLAKYVKDIKSLNTPYEIVAVNDGSTDESLNILLSAAKLNRNLRIINLDGRYGKQAAITAGMDACDKNSAAIILADIDILNPIGVINLIVEHFQKGSQIVYARRDVLNGRDKIKLSLSDRIVNLGLRFFGIKGNYTGKTNISLFSRSVADVILSFPDKNKYLRTVDNWVGWEIDYISYPSGYNKTELKRKQAQASLVKKSKFHDTEAPRDKMREHTPSLYYALTISIISLALLCVGIYFAVELKPSFYYQLILWLSFILTAFVAPLFYIRAVLIKRVGIIHGAGTEKIYVIKNVVN